MALMMGTVAFAEDYIVQPGAYTIETALHNVRNDRIKAHNSDSTLQRDAPATVRLQKGVYRLTQPVIIRPEDSNLRIVAEEGAVISGGVQITGWRRQGSLWVADVPRWNGRPLEFRQLYVNGIKATWARDVDDFEKMARIRSVDAVKEELYVPADAVKSLVGDADVEMVLHEMWCVANLRVREIKVQGDSAVVRFHQPESHIHFSHPWPRPMVTTDGHNSAFYLQGSRRLLDTEGEWWLDRKNEKVYYKPRRGEDMKSATVEAPALETLLQVSGTADRPVRDVSIEGVTFEYSTWLRPSIMGHTPLQAGMYMLEGYELPEKMIRRRGDHKLDNQDWLGRPAAAVCVNGGEGIDFKRCTFQHLASTGLDYCLYIKGGECDANTFTDIGGNGILAGSFGSEADEAHYPMQRSDMREVCTDLTISNNKITDVTNEDWGCVGIGAGYVRGINILNNEISEVSYTGISLGWGWNRQPNVMANNTVRGNLIFHYAKHMYDTAGIYTLGAQPGTIIEGNEVRDIYSPSYVHDPNHWFWLYTDEGSSYMQWRNNKTPSDKFLKNANGPGVEWE